jgi:hypothetical protein
LAEEDQRRVAVGAVRPVEGGRVDHHQADRDQRADEDDQQAVNRQAKVFFSRCFGASSF